MRALIICVLISVGGSSLQSANPSFREIYDLLRTNVTGLDEKALEQAATRGLMEQLAGKATLVDRVDVLSTNLVAVARARLFGERFGYVRISSLDATLPEAFGKAVAELGSTNELKGLVIDLRFAGGEGYAAAVAVAGELLAQPEPIMDYGEGVKRAATNPGALRVPVAVLINRQTAAAAEALAAALRETGRALLLGARSAGRAYVVEDHVLSSGQTLRLAVKPIKVGQGKILSEEGVTPDLPVEVTPAHEAVYFEDPYASLDDGAQNQTSARASRRLTEADLVRMLRESQSPDQTLERRPETEPVRQVMSDPVLARALDVLKGLSVVHQSKSF